MAKTEYVVVVEATVDAGRVRERLARAGLLVAPAGEVRRYHVRLEAEGLEDYAAYRALRETLLEGVGVRSALPVELERGRAVLDVDGELAGDALLAALVRAAPPGTHAHGARDQPRAAAPAGRARPRARAGQRPASGQLTRRIQIGIEFAFLANHRHVAQW